MVQTIKIGNEVVAKVGHGLMRMTWTPSPVSDDVAFESIKASIDATPEGVKMFLNSGEFYAQDLSVANLELLSRFFEKYPAYADRTFLSVKGGVVPGSLTPDSSMENLRRSVDAILAALRGTKSLDLYEPARVDPKQPIEKTMENLKTLVDEGKFRYIGLSECKAETLQRAQKVAHVTAVEIEVGPLSFEEETRKVLAASNELGVVVVAYSPISQGMFTGKYSKPDDAPEGQRKHLPRWTDEEIFKHNFQLVERFKSVAEKKGITMAQLAIAWVGSLGENVMPLPGSSHKARTEENCAAMNVELTDGEVKELTDAVTNFKVLGTRYTPDTPFLWG